MATDLGTDTHRDLFCGEFVRTHRAYDPAGVTWPELSPDELGMLAGLPVWSQSVNTEHETAVIVRAMADHEEDPVLAEAIALQAFEEDHRFSR